jgi:hypothetical protein
MKAQKVVYIYPLVVSALDDISLSATCRPFYSSETEIRYRFYKRLGGPRGLSRRVWKVHPYQYSNPGPSITQRVTICTCITLSRPALYKSKEDSYGTNTIFSTSDVVRAPKNIDINRALTSTCSFDSLNLSSYNVRSLFTACKHIYHCCIFFEWFPGVWILCADVS